MTKDRTLASEFEALCPCCKATLVIDANLKRIVRHQESERADKPELDDVQKILAEEGFDSPKFIELAGKDAEGVIIATNLDRDDPRPVVQNFLKNYKAAYKIDPDMVGASSYDAFMILAEAIRRARHFLPSRALPP